MSDHIRNLEALSVFKDKSPAMADQSKEATHMILEGYTVEYILCALFRQAD